MANLFNTIVDVHCFVTNTIIQSNSVYLSNVHDAIYSSYTHKNIYTVHLCFCFSHMETLECMSNEGLYIIMSSFSGPFKTCYPSSLSSCHPPHDDVIYMQDNCKYVLDTKEGILGPLKTGVTIIENSPY